MDDGRTKRLVYIAFTGVIVLLLAKLTKFPIFPMAPFLKMELGEIPLLLVVMFGSPAAALVSLLLKEILSFLLFGSNPLALAADFVACASFLLAFALLRAGGGRLGRTASAVLLAGAVRMAVAIPVNLVVLKLQFGTPPEAVWAMMIYILPFNFLKCILDGACTAPLYRRLEKPMAENFRVFVHK